MTSPPAQAAPSAFAHFTEHTRRLLIRVADAKSPQDATRSRHSVMQAAAEDQALGAGLLAYKRSPKGQKRWYVLTPEGEAAMPEVRRLQDAARGQVTAAHNARKAAIRGRWEERAHEAITPGCRGPVAHVRDYRPQKSVDAPYCIWSIANGGYEILPLPAEPREGERVRIKETGQVGEWVQTRNLGAEGECLTIIVPLPEGVAYVAVPPGFVPEQFIEVAGT